MSEPYPWHLPLSEKYSQTSRAYKQQGTPPSGSVYIDPSGRWGIRFGYSFRVFCGASTRAPGPQVAT